MSIIYVFALNTHGLVINYRALAIKHMSTRYQLEVIPYDVPGHGTRPWVNVLYPLDLRPTPLALMYPLS